jgi:uncharacterized protein YlaI
LIGAMVNCIQCGAALTADDVGLHKKLVNRGATEYCCPACLASHFHLEEIRLREMAERFRAQGCPLFGPKP